MVTKNRFFNLRKSICTLAGVLFGMQVMATPSVGVGVELNNYSNSLRVPFLIGDSLMLEPVVSHSKYEYGSSQGRSTYENYELALGVFGLRSAGESSQIYYGLRLGVFEESNKHSFSESDTLQTSAEKTDGYSVRPTVGLSYQFNDRFSLSAEVGYYHAEIDKFESSYYGKNQGLENTLVFRFYL